jgi:hypothetical protein
MRPGSDAGNRDTWQGGAASERVRGPGGSDSPEGSGETH